jgi:hypothetical protein
MSGFYKPPPPIPFYPATGLISPFTNGNFVLCGYRSGAIHTSAASTADKIYAYCSLEKKGSIINQLAIRRNSAFSGALAYVGAYSDLGTNRVPTTKIFDLGVKDVQNAGIHIWNSRALPYTIPENGFYWWAVSLNGTAQVSVLNDVHNADDLGYRDENAGGDIFKPVLGMAMAAAFGALPTTFVPVAAFLADLPPALWRSYSYVAK